MTAEAWRNIPGFAGYEVSDLGRVRSHQKYRGSSKPRILRTPPDRDGYSQAHLRLGASASVVMRVHILVMLAFAGEREDGRVVRHLDGDASNNALENLRYGTPSENSLDQVRHGTHPFARRTHCKHEHEYTPENTAIYTSSKGRPFRQCVACNQARVQRQRNLRGAA